MGQKRGIVLDAIHSSVNMERFILALLEEKRGRALIFLGEPVLHLSGQAWERVKAVTKKRWRLILKEAILIQAGDPEYIDVFVAR